jgi:hypothetical protein
MPKVRSEYEKSVQIRGFASRGSRSYWHDYGCLNDLLPPWTLTAPDPYFAPGTLCLELPLY